MNPPVEGLAQVALAAARAGADAIAQVLTSGGLELSSKSAAHDLVTSADQASERAVLGVLRAARPHDAVVGEETGVHEGSSDTRWFVDPLDGTVNFVYGRAGWAVSVGAEVAGEPVVGAVICPGDGRWAVAGPEGVKSGGFHTSDERLITPRPPRFDAAAEQTSAADALISIGQPYGLVKRQQMFAVVGALIGRVRGARLTGTAAAELMGLAGGDGDAFLAFDLPPWDTVAGIAIVRACGGTVRTARTASGLSVQVITRSAALADDLARWVAEPVS